MKIMSLRVFINAKEAIQHSFTIFEIGVLRFGPHFSNKPNAQTQSYYSKQLTQGFKARFVIGLFHLTRKLERVSTHVQGVFCGSFGSYQFAHGDVL